MKKMLTGLVFVLGLSNVLQGAVLFSADFSSPYSLGALLGQQGWWHSLGWQCGTVISESSNQLVQLGGQGSWMESLSPCIANEPINEVLKISMTYRPSTCPYIDGSGWLWNPVDDITIRDNNGAALVSVLFDKSTNKIMVNNGTTSYESGAVFTGGQSYSLTVYLKPYGLFDFAVNGQMRLQGKSCTSGTGLGYIQFRGGGAYNYLYAGFYSYFDNVKVETIPLFTSADFSSPAYALGALLGQNGWWNSSNYACGTVITEGSNQLVRLGGSGSWMESNSPWIGHPLDAAVNVSVTYRPSTCPYIDGDGWNWNPVDNINFYDNKGQLMLTVNFNKSTNHITAGSGTTFFDSGIPFAGGQDYPIMVCLKPNGKFDLTINGTKCLTDKTYAIGSGLGFLRFRGGGAVNYRWGGYYSYFDNIHYETMPTMTRGHCILVKKGLQIQAFTQPWETTVSLPRFYESNFTTMNFGTGYILDSSWIEPGMLWAKYISGTNYMPHEITALEQPYLDNLVSIQWQDEQDITNPTTVNSYKTWFADHRQLYPDVIGHEDQPWNQSSYEEIRSFMVEAKPDMMMCCCYPFSGSLEGNSVWELYNAAWKFRNLGLAGWDGTGNRPIPYGMYLQAFPSGFPHTVSESELYLNQFALWAFGFKFVNAWTYICIADDSPSILFSTYGDSSPTTKFYQMAACNQQGRNIGPALVRLLSADVRYIPGQDWEWYGGGLFHRTVNNPTPTGMTAGISVNTANPYITNVSATNLGSTNHGGLKGDVIVGFFKPLHEDFDGQTYSDQKYFMVVNGLINQTTTSLKSTVRQRIRINFNFGTSGITSLQRMRRSDGQVETVSLVSDGGSLYHYDLELDGGEGDLFKYNTGAPFVGTVGLP